MSLSQRQYFNNRVDEFDIPQAVPVLDRLRNIVGEAGLQAGEVVLDVGTGVGVLISLIQSFRPARIIACDLAEKMLERLKQKYPQVDIYHTDVSCLSLEDSSIDVIFLNAMYGNIDDKPKACCNVARMLRPGGRMVVSHPEGREFVEKLRQISPLSIESLPSWEAFKSLLEPFNLNIIVYRDIPNLYLMVARKN